MMKSCTILLLALVIAVAASGGGHDGGGSGGGAGGGDGGYRFEKDYIITVGPRMNQTHPHYDKYTEVNGQPFLNKFYLNGVEMPELTLERGKTYTFRFNATGAAFHTFFLFRDTKDAGLGCISCGQEEDSGYFEGFFGRSVELAANGQILYWAVPHDAPSTLWYGCTFHGYMGYKINIVGDGKADELFQKSKPRWYVVQDVPKYAHPWMTEEDRVMNPSNIGFAINGFEGQSLILLRGEEYNFLLLNSKENPLVLPTFSSLGGVGDESIYQSLWAENGVPKVWTYKVPRDGPDYSFYQSLKTKRVGGHITFLDKNTIDYTVWVDLKTSEHPYYNKGDNRGYIINGVQGAKLTLEVDRTYSFLVESDIRYPLRLLETEGLATFTLDQSKDGNPNWEIVNLGWTDPARHMLSVERLNRLPTSQNYMLMTFKPTEHLPKTLYYSSGLQNWMGGEILLRDKCDVCDDRDCTDDKKRVVSLDIIRNCNGEYIVEKK